MLILQAHGQSRQEGGGVQLHSGLGVLLAYLGLKLLVIWPFHTMVVRGVDMEPA